MIIYKMGEKKSSKSIFSFLLKFWKKRIYEENISTIIRHIQVDVRKTNK